MTRSGRTRGPRPTTTAPQSPNRASPAAQRDRFQPQRPSQPNVSPPSRPEVVKSQNGVTAATTRAPAGTSRAAASRDRWSRAAPKVASASPPTPQTRPSSTATHSIFRGSTRSPTATSHTHRALVVASTRSPTLNTGP
jgi:hypothetical protein